MTVREKLSSLLTGSPAPVPALGSRVYSVTAAQRSVYPYLVFQLVSEMPILTLDGYEGTRRWRYQLAAFSQDLTEAESVMKAVDAILFPHTDRPAAGIQTITPMDLRHGWSDTDRVFSVVRDVEIWEDLP